MKRTPAGTWRNWAGNQQVQAGRVRAPGHRGRPRRHREAGRGRGPDGEGGRLGPQLHRHRPHRRAGSWSSTGTRQVLAVDTQRYQVTVQAGITLERAERRARPARPGHAEPRRHRLPDRRRGDLHVHPRHRRGADRPGRPDHRAAAGDGRRLGRVVQRRRGAGDLPLRPRRPRRARHRVDGDAPGGAGLQPPRAGAAAAGRRRASRPRRPRARATTTSSSSGCPTPAGR